LAHHSHSPSLHMSGTPRDTTRSEYTRAACLPVRLKQL
jgi:hypothetical protein